jgi:hypothetical protein
MHPKISDGGVFGNISRRGLCSLIHYHPVFAEETCAVAERALINDGIQKI